MNPLCTRACRGLRREHEPRYGIARATTVHHYYAERRPNEMIMITGMIPTAVGFVGALTA